MPRDQTAQEQQAAEDRAAIIEVIRTETQSFVDMDFEAWAACWVQDARTHADCISPTIGLNATRGWPAIAADIKAAFAGGFSCDMARFRQENHQVSIRDGMAWVVFDGWAENHDGVPWDTHETRVLERDGGVWRIAYSSFVLQGGPGEPRREIAVDAKGRVTGASADGLDRLGQHPTLTISAGRIRAHRRDWDKVLQREIARAGRYHGFFAHQKFAAESGGPLQYPVVLGETDDGGIALAFISVRDGATYLRIDGDAHLHRRLQTAKVVFGLSDGQFRLAELIADGDGLKAAAGTLGISVNTARTHLTRLYEKTGVNTQTALVRLLLSVG